MFARSRLDFDSTPPVASVRPSGLKATEVTLRPIVPAVIVPSTFGIIAVMSATLGIAGIEPGLIFPRLGSEAGLGSEPIVPVMPPLGEVVKCRERAPGSTYH